MERGEHSPEEGSVEVADYQDTEPAKFDSETRHYNEAEFVEGSAKQLTYLLTDKNPTDRSQSRKNFAQSLSEQLLYSRAQRYVREKNVADRIDAPDLEPADRYEALRFANSSLYGAAQDFYEKKPSIDEIVDQRGVAKSNGTYDVLIGRALLGDDDAEKRLIAITLMQDDYQKEARRVSELPPETMGKTTAMGSFRARQFSGEETIGGRGLALPVPELLKDILTEHLNELNLANLANQRDRSAVEGGSNKRLFNTENAGRRLFSLLTESNGFTSIDGVIVPSAMEEDEAKRYAAAFMAYEEHFAQTEQTERSANEAARLDEVAKLEGMIATLESKPQVEEKTRTVAQQISELKSKLDLEERDVNGLRVKFENAQNHEKKAGLFGKGKAKRELADAEKAYRRWENSKNDTKQRLQTLEQEETEANRRYREIRDIEANRNNYPDALRRNVEDLKQHRWLPQNKEAGQA